MRNLCVVLALSAIVVLLPRPVYGQAQDAEPLTSRPIVVLLPGGLVGLDSVVLMQRMAELDIWIREYTRWKKWALEWRGRREPGWFKGYSDRKIEPAPPDWLAEDCQALVEDSGRLFDACQLYRESVEDTATGQMRETSTYTKLQKEIPTKTLWWEHVHFDLMWTPPDNSQVRVYGLLGAHITIEVEGRFQIFGAPGIMLVSIPNAFGGRDFKPSPDYGFTYRLFDFRMPGIDQSVRLNFNFVEVMVMGLSSGMGDLPVNAKLTLAGFSISPKPRR